MANIDSNVNSMNTAVARQSAKEMILDAKKIDSLLNEILVKLNEINDPSKGTYYGGQQVQNFCENIRAFKSRFSDVYHKIDESAQLIIDRADDLDRQ